jgi:hypothetical protein
MQRPPLHTSRRASLVVDDLPSRMVGVVTDIDVSTSDAEPGLVTRIAEVAVRLLPVTTAAQVLR